MLRTSNEPRQRQTNAILIVDDDPIARKLLETIIVAQEYPKPVCLDDSRQIQASMQSNTISLVLLDLHMPHIRGQESLGMLSSDYPDVPVIVITSEDSIETAVECMKLGAFNFMTKPIERNRLAVALRNAFEFRELRREVRALNTRATDQKLRKPEAFADIITHDLHMHELFRSIEAVAGSEQTVLITGESGTGKELFARAVHDVSFPQRPFIAVNVAGLDDTMFSDTIFGHVGGAFTGADGIREGLASRAAKGTLFLDEIGDLSIQSQTKLLRLVQEREYYPLGGDDSKRFFARVIAATNTNVEELVEAGTFRKDLYYRLLTHRFHIPPLRERVGDVSLLIDHFACEAFASYGANNRDLPSELITLLLRYTYPGNVRELRSIIFDISSRLVSGANINEIIADCLIRYQGDQHYNSKSAENLLRCFGRFPTVGEIEELLIEAALKECDGNQSNAARLIGLSQSTLSRKMKR